MTTPQSQHDPLSVAYAPLRAELDQITAPAELDKIVMAAFRARPELQQRWFASLTEWLRLEKGFWMPLGGACAAALAALVWLRPMLHPAHAPAALQRAAAPAISTEVATAFFPVGDPARLDAAQQARMVRVRLPRATLASYGLPFNPELADQPIDADLLVGDDGSTLALRFVHGAQKSM